MINRHLHRSIPGAIMAGAVVAIAIANGGCSAASSIQNAAGTISEAASGCDEFSGGESSVDKLSIDGDTKAFVSASTNLVSVVTKAEAGVFAACKAIDKDLNLPDTWSAMEGDAGISDAAVTEACKQASAKITAVLQANASAGCNLVIAGGHCEVDAEAQATCQATCTGMATCSPGDITTLCMPGAITGECDGMCNASATCEGSATAEAQCTGECTGECTGMCDATACQGTRCKGKCEGKCTADCKLAADAQVMCGASVHCRGGCSVMYKAPKCETTVTPPKCTVSETCKSSCTSKVEAKAECTPPSASLECSVMASADLQAVVDTVKKNLPSIILLVKTQSAIIIDASTQVANTGNVVVKNVTSLGGKAVACAKSAVEADLTASASLKVSVSASANVSGSCGGPTSGS